MYLGVTGTWLASGRYLVPGTWYLLLVYTVLVHPASSAAACSCGNNQLGSNSRCQRGAVDSGRVGGGSVADRIPTACLCRCEWY